MPTPKPKLEIYNQRVLQVIQELKAKMSQRQVYESIGCSHANASKYQTGGASFRTEHILALCKLTGVSADWILGLSPEKYRKELKTTDPVKILERAASQLKGVK